MQFSSDQQRAIDQILAWIVDPTGPQRMTLGGYAGTGKSTLIRAVVDAVGGEVSICAFTGKAVYVLRQKGLKEAVTLHRLIYKVNIKCTSCGQWLETCENNNAASAIKDKRCPQLGTKTSFSRVTALLHNFVIVDEASMLNRKLMEDLESYGTKVLYVGDHGQLEPIGDDPRLMAEPEIRLEQIHRQAAESSIIRFAHELRLGGAPSRFRSDEQVTLHRGNPHDLEDYDAVLVGFNKTRVAVNARIRERRGFAGELPQKGERVMCLRNDSELGIFNGMQATVVGVEDMGVVFLDLVDDAGTEFPRVAVNPDQFGQEKTIDTPDRAMALFDFGYAMTVHKSQGSEFKRVCVFEQIVRNWSATRWRYTAATRASEHLSYCLPR